MDIGLWACLIMGNSCRLHRDKSGAWFYNLLATAIFIYEIICQLAK